MDDLLVGYVLDALEPAERRAVEARLAHSAEARRELALLRAFLAPLALDRADPEPPAGLVQRTMARITAQLPAEPLVPATLARADPVYPSSRWRRADVFVAATILILIGGLGTAGVARVQRQRDILVCQNNLRQMYGGLTMYAGNHADQFPFIDETPPRNVAAAYLPILVESGAVGNVLPAACPARLTDQPVSTVLTSLGPNLPDLGYAYTLGYRDRNGQLHGLSRAADEPDTDYLPIMADRPAAVSHATGQNVLFVGGNVRYSTTSRCGVNADEIYKNQHFKLAAGLHRRDTSLGEEDARP